MIEIPSRISRDMAEKILAALDLGSLPDELASRILKVIAENFEKFEHARQTFERLPGSANEFRKALEKTESLARKLRAEFLKNPEQVDRLQIVRDHIADHLPNIHPRKRTISELEVALREIELLARLTREMDYSRQEVFPGVYNRSDPPQRMLEHDLLKIWIEVGNPLSIYAKPDGKCSPAVKFVQVCIRVFLGQHRQPHTLVSSLKSVVKKTGLKEEPIPE